MSDLDERSIALRKKILDVVAVSRKGHIKTAFSCLEIVRVLYDDILKPDDRFILSKGHGCLAQYVLLQDKGFITEGELMDFCKDGALLGGHPSHKIPGVHVSTGALGHGLPLGVGFALAGHRTFVLMGDGECDEGSVWEAAMCASKHKLGNLTVIIDYNEQQSYGTTHDVCELEPLMEKWIHFGFHVGRAGGHDKELLKFMLEGKSRSWFLRTITCSSKPSSDIPRCIIAHTQKGKGIKFIENNFRWHYRDDVSDQEMADLYRGLVDYA